MAHKNHLLDERIASAALNEFSERGFEKASMRKIASEAGVTIGAIYTRYSTKDSLFCSLVQPLIGRIESAFRSVRSDYYEQPVQLTTESMSASIQYESTLILHLLFDDYQRAVLLFCRSRGSSLESFFDQIIQRKIEETLSFFDRANINHPDINVLRLLISSQFHMYSQVISEGYNLEEARKIIHAAMTYHAGGWLALLELPRTK